MCGMKMNQNFKKTGQYINHKVRRIQSPLCTFMYNFSCWCKYQCHSERKRKNWIFWSFVDTGEGEICGSYHDFKHVFCLKKVFLTHSLVEGFSFYEKGNCKKRWKITIQTGRRGIVGTVGGWSGSVSGDAASWTRAPWNMRNMGNMWNML